MKKLFLLMCLTGMLVTHLHAQSAKDKAAEEQAMKAWMTYMTPGEPHKMLASSAGEWQAEVLTWMDPSQPPMKSEAHARNEMILGGRYLNTQFTGNMMGMPFEGTGVTAYDNGTGLYHTTWMDNMGTGVIFLKGKASADGKTINFMGTTYDPVEGKEVKMRELMTMVSNNEMKLEIFIERKGKEAKVNEITYRR